MVLKREVFQKLYYILHFQVSVLNFALILHFCFMDVINLFETELEFSKIK